MINTKGKYVLVVCPNPAIDIFAWLDEFEIGKTNRILEEKKFPGGKGVHVAMGLSELNVKVILLGFWGSVSGRWIQEEVNKYYPNVKCVGIELEDWSRSCYTFKSTGYFDDTELLNTGPQINSQSIEDFFKCYKKYLSDAKAVAMSGSWPKGAFGDEYMEMIKIAKELATPIFLDSTGAQLDNALKVKPFCIHLNRPEVLSYSGIGVFEEACQKITDYCEVAAITDGSNGLYYIRKNKMIHALKRVEALYSAVGSGDCLLAGIIAGFVNELENQSIADLGAACGAANCVREELGMFHKEKVDKLLKQSK